MQDARHREPERWNRCLEALAVIAEHVIAAVHCAHRCLEHGTARVAEALAGFKVGLLADHALAAHFLGTAIRVGDDPVARNQTGRHVTIVAYRHRIGEYETLLARLGLILEIGGLDFNVDQVTGLVHGRWRDSSGP